MFPFWAFEHKWLDLSAIVWVWISSQMRTAIIDNHSSCARSDGGDDRAWNMISGSTEENTSPPR